jgi:hypothetical protein
LGAPEALDQPINGSTDQPINGSTDQPINGSTDQPINGSTDQSGAFTGFKTIFIHFDSGALTGRGA